MSTNKEKIKEVVLTSNQLVRFQKQFGKRIKEIRLEKGISQVELASYINSEKTSISRIENGRTNFTFSTALKLSLAMNVELKELFNFKFDK